MAAAVLSLREEGIARLVFDKAYTSFEGVLFNKNEEVFALRGIPSRFSKNSLGESPEPSEQQAITSKSIPGLLPYCDLYIVDEETGTNYVLKKVKVTECTNEADPDCVSISLNSEFISFISSEVLIGNRADMEFRQYMNPALVGQNLPIYIGPMKINFHTAITPPTTPMPIPVLMDEQSQPVRGSYSRSYTKEWSIDLGTPMEGDFFQ